MRGPPAAPPAPRASRFRPGRAPSAPGRTRPHLALGLLALAGGIGFSLASCELAQITIEAPRPLVVAEIYLRVQPSGPDAFALLHQSGPDNLPLGDAVVQVRPVGDDEPWRILPDAPLGACLDGAVPPEFDGWCFRLEVGNAFFLEPGGTYEAQVLLPNGGELAGRVTLPGDFALTSPAAEVTRCHLPPGRLLPVAWTRASGARAYVPEAEVFGLEAALEPRGITVPTDPVILQGLSISEEDTDIVFPPQFGIFNRFSSDRDVLLAIQQGLPAGPPVAGRIVVSAQGRNSVNWNRGGNFNPSGAVRVPSLFGDGTGVVAGVVNREFTFTTVPEPGLPACPTP